VSGGVLAWLFVWGLFRFAHGPADATATHSLASVNPDWFYLPGFTFLVPAQLTWVVLDKIQKSCKTVVVV